MSLANKKLFSLLLISLALVSAAWILEYFALLILGCTFLLISLIPKLSKIEKFITPIIAVSFTLFFAELATPLLLPDTQSHTRFDPSSDYASGGYYENIEGFSYRPTAGVHSSRKLTPNDEIIYDVLYSIGTDGYREDISSESYEAYIYGGSFTFGEGLNDNETLSYFLKENHGISTKNVGVHGYGLNQALYNIEQGLTFSDDNGVNILLTAPWHALRSACKPSYAVGSPRYVLVNNRISLNGVCPSNSFLDNVIAKSNVIQLLSLTLANTENHITDLDIDLYLGIIETIFRITKEQQGSLIIAYIDATEQQLAVTKWTNETLLERLNIIADSVVDVTLADTREELDSEHYIHELDFHPSALANIARARLLSEAIRDVQRR